MSMGFQTILKGTTFDVLNTMSFNFIADIRDVSGSGSFTYNLPGFSLSAALMNTFSASGTGERSYNVAVSGQTVSWNVANTCKMMVTATPDSSAGSRLNFTFALYDYSTNPRTFKIAPDFTPYNLVQVMDLTPGYGQIVQTNIPVNVPMVAFHRSLVAGTYDHIWWEEINQNGFWSFKFRLNTGLFPMQTCRIYIFAKLLVNIPTHGFFLYQPGTSNMIWHSNCLPLKMNILNGGTVTSGQPLACTNAVTGCFFIPDSPGAGGNGTQWFNCASAGQENGQFAATTLDRYQQVQVGGVTRPPVWSSPNIGYTECNFYDTYYRQALGV